MAKVTVVMPVYNGAKFLSEAIESVINQTFIDWEMLVINEFGSNDGSAEIVKKFAVKDGRIKLIQNKSRAGLAESLNKGIRMARGEYIARLDADDISLPARFQMQVDYMDNNPDVGVCGTWQEHFGDETWIHAPPVDDELCKAYLLFWCHMCHSTVMLRRNQFLNNDFFYNPDSLVEDFELWNRISSLVKFANIPVVLGRYRRHITQRVNETKRTNLEEAFGKIITRGLYSNLGYKLPAEKHIFLNVWANIYASGRLRGRNGVLLVQLESILRSIYDANEKVSFCKNEALLIAMNSMWRWAKFGFGWHEANSIGGLEDIFIQNPKWAFFKKLRLFFRQNPSLKGRFRKVKDKLSYTLRSMK